MSYLDGCPLVGTVKLYPIIVWLNFSASFQMECKRKLKEETDLLACPACNKNYGMTGDLQPRIFMCNHSVCTKCIDDICYNSQLVCPTCKKKFKIPYGSKSVPENAYIINTLKILQKKKEETFELCKEHRRELSLFCKGNFCGMVICQLCMLESHNGHPVTDVVKEYQEALQKRLDCISKKKQDHTWLCIKGTNCMNSLREMKKNYDDKFDNMVDSVQQNVKCAEIVVEQLDIERDNLVEMKNKVIECGRVSREEVESTLDTMKQGEKPGSHLAPTPRKFLKKEIRLVETDDISALNVPANRKGITKFARIIRV